MSPRAAWRLESLGFASVHDYVTGKVDWMAAGLPTVRANTTERRAMDVMDPSPPTCSPDDLLGDVAGRMTDGRALIVVDHGIVAGRIRTHDVADHDRRAGEVMEIGPTTVRAHEPLEALLDRMKTHHVHEMIVTTPEGTLLGVVRS